MVGENNRIEGTGQAPAFPADVGIWRALGAGLATGAIVAFVAVLLTPLLRRLAGVTDRDLINGASVVGLTVALWLLGGLLFWVLAPRMRRPEAAVGAAAIVVGVLAAVIVFGNIGPAPIAPYPAHFAALAVPLIAIVTLGGAALFSSVLRWSDPTFRYATSGALIASVLAGALVYTFDRRAPVHYELTTANATASSGGPLAAGPLHFVVGPPSEASYTVNEKRSVLPAPDDAVGKTQAITGDVWLTPQGLDPTHTSTVTIDLSTLKSDQPNRDTAVNKLLQLDTYKDAVFTIEQVTGFPQHYQLGTTVNLTLNGMLEVHGQQQPETWTGTAVCDGKQLEVVMSTQFDMRSFGLQPPNSAATVAQPGVKLDAHIISAAQSA